MQPRRRGSRPLPIPKLSKVGEENVSCGRLDQLRRNGQHADQPAGHGQSDKAGVRLPGSVCREAWQAAGVQRQGSLEEIQPYRRPQVGRKVSPRDTAMKDGACTASALAQLSGAVRGSRCARNRARFAAVHRRRRSRSGDARRLAGTSASLRRGARRQSGAAADDGGTEPRAELGPRGWAGRAELAAGVSPRRRSAGVRVALQAA